MAAIRASLTFPALAQRHPAFFWKETQVGLMNKRHHSSPPDLVLKLIYNKSPG